MATANKVAVVQRQGVEPVPAEVIAQSIRNISDGFDRMARSGLTWKAIYLLVANASGESQTTVKAVMFGLQELKRLYLNPPKSKS